MPPIYTWECPTCGQSCDVQRPINARDSSPAVDEGCCSHKMSRSLQVAGFVLSGKGWFKDGYSKPAEPKK